MITRLLLTLLFGERVTVEDAPIATALQDHGWKLVPQWAYLSGNRLVVAPRGYTLKLPPPVDLFDDGKPELVIYNGGTPSRYVYRQENEVLITHFPQNPFKSRRL